MTGTLTIVIGLCGSGKSWLLKRLAKTHPKARIFDEGVADRGKWQKRGIIKRKTIARCLRRGQDVFASDLWCGYAPSRKIVLKHLRQLVPNLCIVWLYFENNIRAANNNCRLRKNKRDAKGHIKINRKWHKRLTVPRDAIVLKIHTLGT